ncbi:hypothetical protein RJ639_024327 [Escallonia herrerae]|uniref:Uncharacterized protein n=1 Tax=Escallonia herrerae TaxID=1293975 RepID=A0AA89ADB1_9ASTE|nr:hypothetical protein RJ639_024327 [Escallonia herrerae]
MALKKKKICVSRQKKTVEQKVSAPSTVGVYGQVDATNFSAVQQLWGLGGNHWYYIPSKASNGFEPRQSTPVFINSNLDTYMAMTTSPDITAGDFKGELEREHLNCFPKLGEIRVYALMMKQNSSLYCLPDTFPIKHAFNGSKGTWFIYMEASVSSTFGNPWSSKCVADDFCNRATDITECKSKNRIKRALCAKAVLKGFVRAVHLSRIKKEKKKVNRKRFKNYTPRRVENRRLRRTGGTHETEQLDNREVPHFERSGLFETGIENEHRREPNSIPVPSKTLSESVSVSVSGIIKKYFSNDDEVTSSSEQLKSRTDDKCLRRESYTTPCYKVRARPKMILSSLPVEPSSGTLPNGRKRPEVGKRLLIAANNLRISATKQKSAFSLCRDGRLLVPKSSTLVRTLVFDIRDEDD